VAAFADPSDPASLPPPRRVGWSREGRFIRLVVGSTAVAIALLMAGKSIRAWLAGADHDARRHLWALSPMALLLAAGEWAMWRERNLARHGEWTAGRVTGARTARGAKGGTLYVIDFECELPSWEVCRGSARVSPEVYEEFGQPDTPLGVLRHPRWPHRCKPVPAFRYVKFLPPGEGATPRE
jgi:hypothetical protein